MNHYAKMCFLAILIALSTKEVTAEMITVNRMNDVKITVEQLLQQYQGKEILTAFDIDMTLTQPNNPATFYPALIKHYAIYKKIMGSLTPEQKDLTATLTVFLPVRLVEAETPQIVSAIQDRGVKTIAFTAMLTGKLKDKNQTHNKIEALRYNALNSLGINFANKPTLGRVCEYTERHFLELVIFSCAVRNPFANLHNRPLVACPSVNVHAPLESQYPSALSLSFSVPRPSFQLRCSSKSPTRLPTFRTYTESSCAAAEITRLFEPLSRVRPYALLSRPEVSFISNGLSGGRGMCCPVWCAHYAAHG